MDPSRTNYCTQSRGPYATTWHRLLGKMYWRQASAVAPRPKSCRPRGSSRQRGQRRQGRHTKRWEDDPNNLNKESDRERPNRKDHYLTNDIAGLRQHRTAKPGNIWKATSRRQQRSRNGDDSADVPETHLSTSADDWEIYLFSGDNLPILQTFPAAQHIV